MDSTFTPTPPLSALPLHVLPHSLPIFCPKAAVPLPSAIDVLACLQLSGSPAIGGVPDRTSLVRTLTRHFSAAFVFWSQIAKTLYGVLVECRCIPR